jgi:hypothetical protein
MSFLRTLKPILEMVPEVAMADRMVSNAITESYSIITTTTQTLLVAATSTAYNATILILFHQYRVIT